MIDAAIVGIGWWGRKIVRAVQGKSRKIRFIRGVSKEPDSVRGFAAEYGFELAEDLSDVLADPRVQAIVLATPHSLHTRQIVQVANSGRAVFSEKPLALKKADAVAAVAACRRNGVVLGLGTNKRFWPANRELTRMLAEHALGDILHIEGHYSNANSGAHFSEWRTLKEEAPGAGMTGAGIHVLDALISLAGPVRTAYAQVISRKAQPDPLDTVTVVLRFANDVSGVLATVRSSPFYWRIHVFGSKGSLEALGENEVVLRIQGREPQTFRFDPVDSLLAEFDAYADAVAGERPYIATPEEMVATVSAFEAIIESMETVRPVQIG